MDRWWLPFVADDGDGGGGKSTDNKRCLSFNEIHLNVAPINHIPRAE